MPSLMDYYIVLHASLNDDRVGGYRYWKDAGQAFLAIQDTFGPYLGLLREPRAGGILEQELAG